MDDDAEAGGGGACWDIAYQFLQDALATATGRDRVEIRVAQGVYKPDRSAPQAGGTGDRDAIFTLVNRVTIAGGFAGFGTRDPELRDPEFFQTILSGEVNGDDIQTLPPSPFPDCGLDETEEDFLLCKSYADCRRDL